MDTMNTDTPDTDAAARGGPSQGYFARKLERERDEIRAQLREEQQLHIQTLDDRDEARQWESQALVARIQRDQFSKTLGEVREILCNALPNENQLTSFMAAKLARERDEWKAKYIQQNKDLGCEMMDPNGTIWDYAKKVQTEIAKMRSALIRINDAVVARMSADEPTGDERLELLRASKYAREVLQHNAQIP